MCWRGGSRRTALHCCPHHAGPPCSWRPDLPGASAQIWAAAERHSAAHCPLLSGLLLLGPSQRLAALHARPNLQGLFLSSRPPRPWATLLQHQALFPSDWCVCCHEALAWGNGSPPALPLSARTVSEGGRGHSHKRPRPRPRGTRLQQAAPANHCRERCPMQDETRAALRAPRRWAPAVGGLTRRTAPAQARLVLGRGARGPPRHTLHGVCCVRARCCIPNENALLPVFLLGFVTFTCFQELSILGKVNLSL